MAEETKELLSCEPERLGHGTYLDEEAKEVVLARRTCIEICLTSNLLCVIFIFPFFLREFELSVRVTNRISHGRCKTVQQLQDHHIRYYLARNHPIAICVRPLPFIYFLA
jgi:adenosine deaminase